MTTVKSEIKDEKGEKIKFTGGNLDALEHPEKGQILIWDKDQLGFGLRVTVSSKTFIVQRRTKGKTVRLSVGDYEEMSIPEAKKRAALMLQQMSDGIDPRAAKRAEKEKGTTLGECFHDYCTWKRDLRETTINRYMDVFDRRLDDWRDVRMADITRSMVREKFNAIIEAVQRNAEKRNDNKPRDGHAEASLVFRLVSSLFNFAESYYEDIDGKPVITFNPVKCLSAIKRNWRTVPRRQNVIQSSELKRFYEGVDRLSDTPRDFLLLLILSGFRLNEAARLTWAEVNLDDSFILLPPERTKNKKPHGLPLSDYLHDMLKRRKQSATSEYVFQSRENGCANFSDPKRAIQTVSGHLGKRFSSHDLRRTYATIGDMIGIPRETVKALLNHSGTDVTSGYIIANIERLREPMQLISDYIIGQMGAPKPEPDDSKVAPIAQAKAKRAARKADA